MKFEAEIILYLQSLFNSQLAINFFKIITYFGSFIGIALLFLLLFFKDKKLAFIYLSISIIASLGNYCLKILIQRPRPYISYPNIVNHLEALGSSMPSSHTIIISIFSIFCIFAINKYLNKKNIQFLFKISTSLLCVIVMLSRMVLGQHYLLDIIIGFIIGLILSFLTLKFYVKKN